MSELHEELYGDFYQDAKPLTVQQLRMSENKYFDDSESPLVDAATDAPREELTDEQELPGVEFSEVPLSEVNEKDYPIKEEPSIIVDLSRVGPSSPNWMKAFFSCTDYAHEVQLNPPKQFNLSLSVAGTPPLPQTLGVKANKIVQASRLDYMSSTGVCIASDKLSVEGSAFDIPIDDKQIMKVWNTPRADKNWSDGSGPAKLRIILTVDGIERQFAVPVQMDSYPYGNTFYRKLTGAETF